MQKVLLPVGAILSIGLMTGFAANEVEYPFAPFLGVVGLVAFVVVIYLLTTRREPTYNLKGFGR